MFAMRLKTAGSILMTFLLVDLIQVDPKKTLVRLLQNQYHYLVLTLFCLLSGLFSRQLFLLRFLLEMKFKIQMKKVQSE